MLVGRASLLWGYIVAALARRCGSNLQAAMFELYKLMRPRQSRPTATFSAQFSPTHICANSKRPLRPLEKCMFGADLR